MNEVTKDMDFAQAYQDDISIGSDSFAEFLGHIRQLFERLRFYNFKLQPKKCSLGYEYIKLLGHIVDGQGIRSDPGKVHAILNAPIPTKKSELSSFHGFAQ